MKFRRVDLGLIRKIELKNKYKLKIQNEIIYICF